MREWVDYVEIVGVIERVADLYLYLRWLVVVYLLLE